MSCWDELYEIPRRLTPDRGHHRIFAPESYEAVRTRRFVPIVHAEALALAAHFPVCWRLRDGEAVLGVLRSLLVDGQGHPIRPTHASGALPLVLRAFPFAVSDPADPADAIVVDEAPADSPTDAGAPILMVDGRPSRGALHRLYAIAALRCGTEPTRRLAAALMSGGFLERWPLDFELNDAGARVCVEDLLVVRPASLQDGGLMRLLGEFGARAAMLMSAHRISLFRISALLGAARGAVVGSAVEGPWRR